MVKRAAHHADLSLSLLLTYSIGEITIGVKLKESSV